tara:strand:- start:3532 stop:3816 length:285 start_codon:yes stop_codon:yes gene_type:complete
MNYILPEIINKIMLYNSHPCADIIRELLKKKKIILWTINNNLHKLLYRDGGLNIFDPRLVDIKLVHYVLLTPKSKYWGFYHQELYVYGKCYYPL